MSFKKTFLTGEVSEELMAQLKSFEGKEVILITNKRYRGRLLKVAEKTVLLDKNSVALTAADTVKMQYRKEKEIPISLVKEVTLYGDD